ncbi:MAG: hypothetical protein M3069_18440, partial [Chloroflexota bacterium]|nr:hypothetical protein [Chloroflexota bacterium]
WTDARNSQRTDPDEQPGQAAENAASHRAGCGTAGCPDAGVLGDVPGSGVTRDDADSLSGIAASRSRRTPSSADVTSLYKPP